MRILFVALTLPFPPTNGQRLRNWALLRALAEEGHEVTLVSFAESPELVGEANGLRQMRGCVELVLLPSPAAKAGESYASRLRALTSALPYGAWRLRSNEMCAAVQRQLSLERFHALICDDIYMVPNLPGGLDLPVLLNKHDIKSVVYRRYLGYERNPLKQAYGWMEYWKLRRWEDQACRSVTGVLACSQLDRELLVSSCPGVPIEVVPNVIEVDGYIAGEGDDGRSVLYVGAMDWLPNQDAVDFFASRVLPLLRRLVPGVRFVVAGRAPGDAFRKRFAGLSDVEFTGWVPDMRAVIARAAICVVPLRIGSGTRLKILEAAAMGKPVVSTGIGAEGLEFANGREILLADEPQKFAAAVAALLRDKAQRRALGESARRSVEKSYGLPALRSSLREAFSQVMEKSFAVDRGSRIALAPEEVSP